MSEKPEEKSWSELPTYGREEEESEAWEPASIPTWMSAAETLRPPERPVGIVDDGRTDAARRWRPGETILGRYVVERELGQGGMGVVYGCMDKVGGVRVAVKGLPPELSHDSVEMEEVRANFQLVYGLSHPNIAGVRQLERDGRGEYYLVMEMAEGESLRKWLRRKWKAGGVPLAEAVKVLRQVASALDYAHAKKIVHRDVKPGNVMIDATGEVKVLDFGLAAQIRTSLSRASHAYQGTSGTGPYMSPEQWRGQPQDGKTDQYALGVMAYEMLAGRLPFENAEVGVLREVVLKEDPPTIPGLPGSAMSAIQRAMSKHAEERFSTCGEFVEALTAESQTVRSVKNTDTEPVVGKGKGHGGGWVAALLLAAGVGVGVWWWQDGVGRQRLAEVVRQAEKLRTAQEAGQKVAQERLAAVKKAEDERPAAQKRAEEVDSKRDAEEGQHTIWGKDTGFAQINGALVLGRMELAREALAVMLANADLHSLNEFAHVGQAMLEHGQWAETVKVFEQVTAREDELAGLSERESRAIMERALYGLGEARYRLGDAEGAVEPLNELIRRWPRSGFLFKAELIIACANRDMGNREEALLSLKDIFTHSPNSEEVNEAKLIYAQMMAESGDELQAFAICKGIEYFGTGDIKSEKERQQVSRALLAAIDLGEKLDRPNDVVESCDAFLKLFPASPEVRKVRAKRTAWAQTMIERE